MGLMVQVYFVLFVGYCPKSESLLLSQYPSQPSLALAHFLLVTNVLPCHLMSTGVIRTLSFQLITCDMSLKIPCGSCSGISENIKGNLLLHALALPVRRGLG